MECNLLRASQPKFASHREVKSALPLFAAALTSCLLFASPSVAVPIDLSGFSASQAMSSSNFSINTDDLTLDGSAIGQLTQGGDVALFVLNPVAGGTAFTGTINVTGSRALMIGIKGGLDFGGTINLSGFDSPGNGPGAAGEGGGNAGGLGGRFNDVRTPDADGLPGQGEGPGTGGSGVSGKLPGGGGGASFADGFDGAQPSGGRGGDGYVDLINDLRLVGGSGGGGAGGATNSGINSNGGGGGGGAGAFALVVDDDLTLLSSASFILEGGTGGIGSGARGGGGGGGNLLFVGEDVEFLTNATLNVLGGGSGVSNGGGGGSGEIAVLFENSFTDRGANIQIDGAGIGEGIFRTAQITRNDSSSDPNKVPEPGTMALMGIGVAGLLALRRRRSPFA